MWLLLFLLFQIFLFIVVGGILTLIVISPIILAIGIFEFIGSLTINNILNAIHKIPFIGPIISGIIGSGIGIVIIFIGLWAFVNYIFIMLRCLGGARI